MIRHEEVFHDVINRHIAIARHFWDHRINNLIAWRNLTLWGGRNEFYVFNWSVWAPGYWGFYCNAFVDGFCAPQAGLAWDRNRVVQHYDASWQWYGDYLFTRYWLYRYAEEAEREAASDYWIGEFRHHRPMELLDIETQNLVRLEIHAAIREAHDGTFYQPVELIGANRGYLAGLDYTVNLTDSDGGEVCDLTRGSIIKIEMPPTNDNPFAVVRVVHAHDPRDGFLYCDANMRVSIPFQDLIDMSNDFRSKVQDGLAAKEDIANGRTLRAISNY